MSDVQVSERSMSITQRLNEPQTQEMLHRLLDHAEELDKLLQAARELPNLVAIAVDLFDSLARQAADQGIDLEQRATDILKLVKKLTEPQNMQALSSLVDHLPKLQQAAGAAEELPNLVAIAIDTFDEWAANLKNEGIELEQSLKNGLYAALYLGGKIRKEELDRLGYLLQSDVLSEASVETVSLAGSALSSCRQGSCEHPVPPRIGLFGMLKAARDPNTQRALAFAVQFSKCFGGMLEAKHPNSPVSQQSQS
ncbi:DUF1641 domain-containing protein [Blastopirellula sp. JC732]|uniref:DUF1641 domain-containing protein n=1 Tax=Blastopirellula sediminis TaxID=2894196 RepID=A0A9X1SFD4_9BACT|nr:DUF1641 domain-containing protein [Blastopirellula sediminis]MCC9609055.1 DUF1641 domain-containing protein [Blastopirellula sediminis]MCC9628168.1 DUF1641 domain-containing protein [Blastopirellula sediminis]